jgi:hypothetical protein
MGDPTSAILAETTHRTQIHPILIRHKISGYKRHVNDILVIYYQRKTNIDKTLTEVSKQGTNTKFTIEK